MRNELLLQCLITGDYMKKYLLAALCSATFLAPQIANAATVVKQFDFSNGGTSVASGSFSYDDSNLGILSYADLINFSLTIDDTYDLAFVGALPAASSYIYFGYDTSSNEFVPGYVTGYDNTFNADGGYSSVLAGTNGTSGFFFDPLAGQADPAGSGFAGTFAEYGPYRLGEYDTLTIGAAVPEPATWAFMICGFGAIGGAMRRKRKTNVKVSYA
jgi:hypothetical protein